MILVCFCGDGRSLFISFNNLSMTFGGKSLEISISLILLMPRCLNSSVDPFLTALINSFLALFIIVLFGFPEL